MQKIVTDKAEFRQYLDTIQQYVDKQPLCCTKYIYIGSRIIRVLCRTPEIIPHLQKQLTFTLHDQAERYDATIVVWKETAAADLGMRLSDELNPRKNMQLMMKMRFFKQKIPCAAFINPEFSPTLPAITVDPGRNYVEAIDFAGKTLYYGVNDFSPEEFIKLGHVLVQQLNVFLKTPTMNLIHGAVVGSSNNGVLFCARGQRGKSTLTVLSMLRGFEYVSDDYLTLEKRGDDLLSSPIYSIITLSPRMYNELYDDLKGKFVSNNARKDKYVINIADYHPQFRVDYPIRLGIFPEIVSDPEPSITPCSAADRGRALVQVIQSTVSQMRDLNDHATIGKLLDMTQHLEFYKFNLCNNIERNTAYLRDFLAQWRPGQLPKVTLERMLVDVTFDLANIIDTATHTIYSLNKFATNIYENLCRGAAMADIRALLTPQFAKYPNLEKQLQLLEKELLTHGLITARGASDGIKPQLNPEFAQEEHFNLSMVEFAAMENKELLK